MADRTSLDGRRRRDPRRSAEESQDLRRPGDGGLGRLRLALSRDIPVSVQGPALVYAAEDSPSNLRSRLESLSAQRNLRLENLDLRVITSDFIRLDHPQDQKRLHETLLLYRPALLVLDPLVRLHCQDENQADRWRPCSATSAICSD